MSEAIEVPGQVLEYVQAQQTLTLATASPSGVPRAGTFLYVNDGATLYFWSRAATITTRQLAQNPIVAFTIDSYTDDLNQTQGVQGVGECSVLLERRADRARRRPVRPEVPEPGAGIDDEHLVLPDHPDRAPVHRQHAGAPPASPGVFGAEFHRERSYSVIQALPLRPAETIVAALGTQSVKAGDVVVRAGTPADKFFIIVSGEAELARPDGDGDARTPAGCSAR